MVSSNNWCFKPLENMQTNLACISVDKPTTVLFVDQARYVFDRIVFAEGTDLHFEHAPTRPRNLIRETKNQWTNLGG
jgi:hypothetical protein